ncbi:MAG: hypothetical protein AAFQ94_15085 [Bacteroidota bacterium]
MKNCLKNFESQEVFKVVQFIVRENFKHHEVDTFVQNYNAEINAVYNEELTYCPHSKVYVERDEHGDIWGTIRVMKWNFVDTLPIQKIFNIDPLDHIEIGTVNDVYHFGRLAIQRNCPSLQLLKKLVAAAITPVCENKHNIAFAECDAKLFRILSLLGIKMQVIGQPIEYLGSETIPVMFTYDGLIGFHRKSKQSYDYQKAPVWNETFTPKLAFSV